MPGTVIRAGYGIFYGAEENEGGNPNRGENVPFNQETRFEKDRPSDRDPFVNKFSDGFPVDSFTLPAPISFRSVYTQRRWPLVNKWNFNLQRDLGWNSVLELAYIGSKGNRLTDNYNGNPLVNDPRPNISRFDRSHSSTWWATRGYPSPTATAARRTTRSRRSWTSATQTV